MWRLLHRVVPVLCISLFFNVQSSLAQVAVSLPELQVEINGSEEIEITVGDLSGVSNPVTAYQFTISYDPSIIEITGAISEGTLSAGTNPTVNTGTSGEITVAWAAASALTGSGILVKLQADFLAQGTSNLNFTQFDFNEGDPTSSTSNGSVTVGTVNTGSVDVELPTSAGGSVGGGQVLVPLTVENLTGLDATSYSFTITYNPAVINIANVSTSGTLSLGSPPSVNTSVAGEVTVSWSSGTALSGSGTLLNLQVDPVGIGTTALNFSSFQFNNGTPSAVTSNGTMTITGSNDVVSVSLPGSLEGNAGESIVIPVSVGDLTGAGVNAYQFTFAYNPAVIEMTGVKVAGTLSAGVSAVTSSPASGELLVTWTSGTIVSGSGTLIEIEADLLGAGISPLTLNNFSFNQGQPPVTVSNGEITVNDTNGAVAVALPQRTGQAGSTITIPVTVGNLTDRNISSFESILDYDDTIMRVTAVNQNGTLTQGTNAIVNLATSGKVNVAWASVSTLTGSGVLFNLEVELLTAGTGDITFDSFTFNEGSPEAALTNGSVTVTGEGTGENINVNLPTGQSGDAGEVLSLPVTVGDLTGKGVTSYVFTVTYNATRVKINGVSTNGTLSAGGLVSANTATPGQAVVTLAGVQALSGSGSLINLDVELLSPGTSNLSFSLFQFNDGTPQANTTNGSVTVNGVATYLQIVHNSPDAPAVDIYINDVKVIDALAYAGATPFLELDTPVVKMDVVRNEATNNNNPITSSNVSLLDDQDYVAVINGLYSGSGKQAIDLVVEESQQEATDENTVGMLVFQGSPDAPPLNVYILDENNNRILTLAKNLEFGEAFLSTEFSPGLYNIEITQANGPLVGIYRADLSRTAGAALLFMVQGFVNPIVGQPDMTVTAYAPDGRAIFLPISTDNEDESPLPNAFQVAGNYPNPFNPTTSIRFDLPEAAEVNISVFDLLGREVMTMPSQRYQAGVEQSVQLDASGLASGSYIYRVVAKGAHQTYFSSKTMTLLK